MDVAQRKQERKSQVLEVASTMSTECLSTGVEIKEMVAAERCLPEEYLPTFNTEFVRSSKEDRLLFAPVRPDIDLGTIKCDLLKRTSGRDSRAQFEGLKLKLPPGRHRSH